MGHRHQSTSVAAFHTDTANGKIGGQRAQVAAAFQRQVTGTSAEVLRAAKLSKNLNLARARVTELADDGVLIAAGERKCTVTGRSAIVWKYVEDVSARVPRSKDNSKEVLLKKLCVWIDWCYAHPGLLKGGKPAALQQLLTQVRGK